MNAFRALLISIFSCIFLYTVIVIAEHGMGLFQIFFRDIGTMGWSLVCWASSVELRC